MDAQRLRVVAVVAAVAGIVGIAAADAYRDPARIGQVPPSGHDVVNDGVSSHISSIGTVESRSEVLGKAGGAIATGVAHIVYFAPGSATAAARSTGGVVARTAVVPQEIPETFRRNIAVGVYHDDGTLARYFPGAPTVDTVQVGAPIGDAVVQRDGATWFERVDDKKLCYVPPTLYAQHKCVEDDVPVDRGSVVLVADDVMYVDHRDKAVYEVTQSGFARRWRLSTSLELAGSIFAATNDAGVINAVVPRDAGASLVTIRLDAGWATEVHRRELGHGRFSKPVNSNGMLVVAERETGALLRSSLTDNGVDRLDAKLNKDAAPVLEHDGSVWGDSADGDRTVLVPAVGTPLEVKVRAVPPRDTNKKPKVDRPPRVERPGRSTPPPMVPRPPNPPTGVVARAGNASAIVSWNDATPNGGAISLYEVRWLAPDGSGSSLRVPGATNTTSATGLTNGTAYLVAVRAWNDAGVSGWSSDAKVTPTADVPAAPTGVVASAVPDGTVALRWNTADGGGRSVTRYEIHMFDGRDRRLVGTVSGEVTALTVSEADGLVLGTEYRFTVTAVNDLGRAGAASEPSAPVTPGRPAGAPQNVVVAPSDGTLAVTWDAPPANGSTISRYVVRGDNGIERQYVNDTNVVLPGLRNGVTYTITVSAESSVGPRVAEGPAATVQGVPGAPPTVTMSSADLVGDRTVRVSFIVDDRQSGPPTCHVVFDGAERWSGACSGSSSVDVGGLAFDTTYTVWAFATNGYGTGANSGSAAVRTNAAPSVTVSKGSPVTKPDCASSACAEFVVRVSGYQPNTRYAVECHSEVDGAAPFYTYFVTTDGSGANTSSVCYFGYSNRQVWAVVNGVSSPRYTW